MLFVVIQRHPDSEKRTHETIDFIISQNVLNKKALQLNICRIDGSVESISWLTCCKGVGVSYESLFKSALRQTIASQIQEFRDKSNINYCSICDKYMKQGEVIHIDHIIQFEELVKKFMLTNKDISIPINYNDYSREPQTNRTCFSDLNKKLIGKRFFKFHEENARLRVSCVNCNLTRPKVTC